MSELRDTGIFRAILESLETGVCFADRSHKILLWNAGAERITGYQRHEAVGHRSRENILAACTEASCELCGAECPFSISLLQGKTKETNIHLQHKAGHHIAVHAWTVPIRDEHGTVLGIATSFDVVRSELTRGRRQSALAVHGCLDEVTGVPNQSFTKFHLRENLAGFAEYQVPFSIVVIQIENFAHIRTACGPQAAHGVLEAVVESIRNSIRPTDFLGRWAEDQFLVIALSCSSAGALKLAERMRKVFGKLKLHWWGDELLITTRMGLASVDTGDTVETLIKRGTEEVVTGDRGNPTGRDVPLAKRAGAEG